MAAFSSGNTDVTGLKSRTRNETKCSSTFQMLTRYREIRESLHLLDSPDVDGLSLNTIEDRRVNNLYERLRNFDSITKRLQKDATTLEVVRALFDCVIEDYLEKAPRLTSTAAIMHSPIFDLAGVKVQA